MFLPRSNDTVHIRPVYGQYIGRRITDRIIIEIGRFTAVHCDNTAQYTVPLGSTVIRGRIVTVDGHKTAYFNDGTVRNSTPDMCLYTERIWTVSFDLGSVT